MRQVIQLEPQNRTIGAKLALYITVRYALVHVSKQVDAPSIKEI